MAGDKGKGEADIRQDFPGGWNGDKNNPFVKSGRTEEQNKFFDFTSKLFQWRKNKTVIHTGKMTHYIPEDNVYVYFRHDDKETVMVVINNAAETKTFKTKRFQENIKNFASGKDILTGKSIDIKNEISLDGKSVLILELN
ncbi:maltodextrin glucosidase [compost metagenome]